MNVLYGTLKAALLFYKKLVKDLESIGFVINPYDFCVANKMIKGKQMNHHCSCHCYCLENPNNEKNSEFNECIKPYCHDDDWKF